MYSAKKGPGMRGVCFRFIPWTSISLIRACQWVPFAPWWCHQMEIFFALLAICAGNSPVTGEFPAPRPVTRSFDVFFDLGLNERLSKQSWGCWFETLPRPLWRHRNALIGTPMAFYQSNHAISAWWWIHFLDITNYPGCTSAIDIPKVKSTLTPHAALMSLRLAFMNYKWHRYSPGEV